MKTVNDAAGDETVAHMSMFYPRENPGYYAMCEKAKGLVVGWASNDWYETSTGGGDGLVGPGFEEEEEELGGWDEVHEEGSGERIVDGDNVMVG